MDVPAGPAIPNPILVSVVVPIFNPGSYLDSCVASLLAQTLPPPSYEVILVDDGSTDGSAARVDALAAEHPRVRSVHIPNSGWAGRPRNVGIDEARGAYVQFVDQDDTLAPEALEHLHAFGIRNASDIVIGKVASNFRGVPQGLLSRTRDACTIHDTPLINSLTPHKMFRTVFIREHGLRFPEGRRRLEDQHFMVRAYFAARVVSILADQVYYHYSRRGDGGNAGSAAIEPAGYYGNLREVIEVVLANTTPGVFRDGLLRRFLRVEILGRLSEPALPRYEPEFRDRLAVAAGGVVRDLLDPAVDAGLPAISRLRAGLLRADRRDDLLTLAQRCASLRLAADLESTAWDQAQLLVSSRVQLVDGPGGVLSVRAFGDRRHLDPALTEGILDGTLDVTSEVESVRAVAYLRERDSGVEWPIPADTVIAWERLPSQPDEPGPADETLAPVAAVTARVRPLVAAGGAPLVPGTWEPWVRFIALGLDRRVRIQAPDGRHARLAAPIVLAPRPLLVRPRLDDDGALAVVVEDLSVGARARWRVRGWMRKVRRRLSGMRRAGQV